MLNLRKKLLRLYQHLFIKYRIIKTIREYNNTTYVFGDYQPAGAIKQLNAIREIRRDKKVIKS